MPHAHVLPSSPSLCHSPPKSSSSSSISLRISGEQEVVTSCLFLSFHANYSQRLWVDIYIGGRKEKDMSISLSHAQTSKELSSFPVRKGGTIRPENGLFLQHLLTSEISSGFSKSLIEVYSPNFEKIKRCLCSVVVTPSVLVSQKKHSGANFSTEERRTQVPRGD